MDEIFETTVFTERTLETSFYPLENTEKRREKKSSGLDGIKLDRLVYCSATEVEMIKKTHFEKTIKIRTFLDGK